ncbi:hypothetical protein V8E55_006562 [Tylopilus felleus]
MSAAGSPSIPTPAEIENLSVLFIGFVASTVFYGLTFFQTYIYYSRSPRDNRWLRYLVATLCTLDTTASALVSEILYDYLITMFDVNMNVLYATTTFCFQYMISVLLTFISQVFFVHRVFQVTGRSWPLTLVLLFLSFIGLVFGLTASGQMVAQRRLSAFGTLNMEITASISLVSSVTADIIVFVTMCYSLRRARFPEIVVPEGFLSTVATVLVARGLAFTVVQIAYLCVFLAAPSRQFWIPLQMVACKIYVNTLLGHLNLRTVRHGQGVNEEDSLTDRKVPGTGRVPTSIIFNTDAKDTSQSVHLATRNTDTDSNGTGMDFRKTFQDEHGNVYTEMSTSTGSTQSQADKQTDKESLSQQL